MPSLGVESTVEEARAMQRGTAWGALNRLQTAEESKGEKFVAMLAGKSKFPRAQTALGNAEERHSKVAEREGLGRLGEMEAIPENRFGKLPGGLGGIAMQTRAQTAQSQVFDRLIQKKSPKAKGWGKGGVKEFGLRQKEDGRKPVAGRSGNRVGGRLQKGLVAAVIKPEHSEADTTPVFTVKDAGKKLLRSVATVKKMTSAMKGASLASLKSPSTTLTASIKPRAASNTAMDNASDPNGMKTPPRSSEGKAVEASKFAQMLSSCTTSSIQSHSEPLSESWPLPANSNLLRGADKRRGASRGQKPSQEKALFPRLQAEPPSSRSALRIAAQMSQIGSGKKNKALPPEGLLV